MGVWVGLLPRKLESACIDFHQTGFVGKGHLPGKGVCGGANIFGYALLQPAARGVCVSLSAFFIINIIMQCCTAILLSPQLFLLVLICLNYL